MMEGMARPSRFAILTIVAVVLATAGVSCGSRSRSGVPQQTDSTQSAVSGLPTGTLRIFSARGSVTVRVEIAETSEAREVGLMWRRRLAPDAGMAFLYDEAQTNPFWMKDTLIPLSIAFWDESRRIVAILDMAPCPREPCREYFPGTSYIGAVEVNQVFFRAHGVKVGDQVELER